MKSGIAFLLLFFSSMLTGHANEIVESGNESFLVILPEIIVQDVKQEIVFEIINPDIAFQLEDQIVSLKINGKLLDAEVVGGLFAVAYPFPEKGTLVIECLNTVYKTEVNPIPLWLSILPPLIAIFFALFLKEVYSALAGGIWIGATVIAFYQGEGFFEALFTGFLDIIDKYIIQSMLDSGHLAIILFSTIIAGTVSLITKNGGMRGVVDKLAKYAKSPRSGSLITWLMGIVIFFDDYANTLVVGNTMRPLTDKLRISREKLSYIIDSTAAPVASIAFVTTWIGAELSYIQDGINNLNLDESAYGVFFGSLAYSFYPVFTLAFIFIISWKGLDFGPMLKAERHARARIIPEIEVAKTTSEYEEASAESAGAKPRIWNAILPILVIVAGTMAGLVYTGWDQLVWDDPALGFFGKLSETIGAADSYAALLWSSFASLFVALVLTISQRLMNLRETMESIVIGFKTMLPAVMIMVLAWAVALVTKHMHTADFISRLLLDASLSPYFLPSITFIMAGLVSFSTGSSWGTMAIMYPLILPAGWLLAEQSGLEYQESLAIFHNIVAAVLTGSVLGDHCSPISDTTILSSLASSCQHIDHVRTQLPYALVTGLFSIILGSLPAAFGFPSWILFPAGIAGIYLVIILVGKKSEHPRVEVKSV